MSKKLDYNSFEMYIHFTDKISAEAIVDSSTLLRSSFVDGVFAVAAGGSSVPGVQKTKLGRALNRDFAVVFNAVAPCIAFPEEVIWKKNELSIKNAFVVPAQEAVDLLDGSKVDEETDTIEL